MIQTGVAKGGAPPEITPTEAAPVQLPLQSTLVDVIGAVGPFALLSGIVSVFVHPFASPITTV
jgi:hypothetical protein